MSKWPAVNDDDIKILEFMYYLYLKDVECKIIKNKTLEIKTIFLTTIYHSLKESVYGKLVAKNNLRRRQWSDK